MKLVLEGGGVRATYGAGVLHGLLEEGVEASAVIGSSSGSINAAFYAARQTQTLLELWTEHVPTGGFISWRRLFTPGGRPGLDVDGMLDEVIAKRGLLDVERATGGPTALYVTATDVDRRECVVARPTPADVFEWLRASLAIPVGYNRVVTVGGRRCVDGGVAAPVPFDVPELEAHEGPTVVVLTRTVETKKPPPALWARWWIRVFVPEAARRASLEQHELHNATMVRLSAARGGGEVIVIDPPQEMALSRLTRDQAKVRAGAEVGLRVGRELARRLRSG